MALRLLFVPVVVLLLATVACNPPTAPSSVSGTIATQNSQRSGPEELTRVHNSGVHLSQSHRREVHQPRADAAVVH